MPLPARTIICVSIVDAISGKSAPSLLSIACYALYGLYTSIIGEITLQKNHITRKLLPFQARSDFFFFLMHNILGVTKIKARH